MTPNPSPSPAAPRALCPVCKKTVYSPAGIHPQCAMARAEPPNLKPRNRGVPDHSRWTVAEAVGADAGDDRTPAAIPLVEKLGVPVRMIRLWIGTGAWPLPRSVCHGTSCFKLSDVECWLLTGAWPTGVHFRGRHCPPAGRRAHLRAERPPVLAPPEGTPGVTGREWR
jgi:hypothetical protein